MISPHMVILQAWRSIGLAGLRSYLAVIAIGIGVAAMIALMNIGDNTKRSILKEFESFGYRVSKVEFYRLENVASLQTLRALNQAFAAMPAIHATELITTSYVPAGFRGQETDLAVHSIAPSFQERMKLTVAKGGQLSPLRNDRPYILLGQNAVEGLQGDGQTVRPGSLVTLNYQETYIVAGILSAYGETNLIGGGVDNAAFVLAKGLHKRSGRPESATNLIFRQSGADYKSIEALIFSIYQANLPDLPFELLSPEQLIASVSRQKRTQSILILSLAFISLLSGGIGIMNIMLVSVQERKSEIGIRVAIGARPRDVQAQITIEAVMLCVLGCGFGVLLGLAATFLYVWLQDWAFHASLRSVFYAVSASVLIGVFFGFYPARQASRLDPVKVLMG